MGKRLLCCTLALTGLMTGVPSAGAVYPDLPESHWAYEAMNQASERKIINGVGNGLMAPDQQLTWGQLLTMVARAVAPEDYATRQAAGLAWDQAGYETILVQGLLIPGDFLRVDGKTLDQPITRQETAALLDRALPAGVTRPTADFAPTLPVWESLTDWGSLGGNYQLPVSRLYQLGVIRGNDQKLFCGSDTLKRADGTVLLMRMLELRDDFYAGAMLPPEAMTTPESTSAPMPTPVPIPEPTPTATPIPTPESTPVSTPEPVPEAASALQALGENGEKCTLLFGNPDQNRFHSEAEARAAMVDITVPVWQLSGGEKVARQLGLTVHGAVAAEVSAIFEEIFRDPEQFPVQDVGGFRWTPGDRGEHLCGTAIDINWRENYQVRNGAALAGDHWLPGEDPLSIPENGSVVRIFREHGWDWGGNAWSDRQTDPNVGYHDYMHFSYLGT